MSDRDDITRALPADGTAAFDPAATRTAEPTSPVAPPDLPPNYTLVGEIGRGAMGVVYRARQVLLDREVAVKLVLAGRHASPSQLARFLAEVRAAAAVDHPNVVRVHDSGEHAGTPFLAMEYVGGGTLSDRLANGPLAPREAVELVAKVADGVQAAHAAGIVHRDLKPGNILLTADGTPKVADFGLAKRPGGTDLTHTGAILGTPGYMAPEQARGGTKTVCPAADVYALGAVLFHCLSGRPPFVGDDALEVVLKAATENPPSLRAFVAGVPRDLDTIVAKCLRKDQAERYPTARELADDLRRWLDGNPISARRSSRFTGPLLVAGMLGTAGMLSGVGWLLFGSTGATVTSRKTPSGLESRTTISGDPRDIAERFLNDAKLNPTNSSALRWTAPGFQFNWTSGTVPGQADRPYYKFTRPLISETRQVDEQTVEFRGWVTVLERVIALGGGMSILPSGGQAKFTMTVRANKAAGAWRVDAFEFGDRGSRAGPAELPTDATVEVIRDALEYPPEAFEKHSLPDLERILGLQSYVFFHTGGTVQWELTVEESGQMTLPPANALGASRPFTCETTEQEGRLCLQIGLVLGKEKLLPLDRVRVRMNRSHSLTTDLPCLWYHWSGTTFEMASRAADLSDGKEHEVLSVTAVETDPPKGEQSRKVVLRLMAKKK